MAIESVPPDDARAIRAASDRVDLRAGSVHVTHMAPAQEETGLTARTYPVDPAGFPAASEFARPKFATRGVALLDVSDEDINAMVASLLEEIELRAQYEEAQSIFRMSGLE